jgi:hypothetical protein
LIEDQYQFLDFSGRQAGFRAPALQRFQFQATFPRSVIGTVTPDAANRRFSRSAVAGGPL